jgi:hypothetical protein
MQTRRVTLATSARRHACTMEASTTLTPAAGTLLRRVLPFGWLHTGDRRKSRPVAPAYRVDMRVTLDPGLIDDDAWVEWGRDNLTADECRRRRQAVETDRAESATTV